MHCIHLVNTHVNFTEDMMDGLWDKTTMLIVAQVSRHGEGLSSTSLRMDNGKTLSQSHNL